MKVKLLIATLTFIPTFLMAQVSGNQIYGNNTANNAYLQQTYRAINNFNQKVRSINTTDSTLQIDISVLLNKRADYYVTTIGLNQEAATVIECNKKINERIKNFKSGLGDFTIEEEDIYVDFISQTKVYDFEVNQQKAEEYPTGYEIKKNIIIKLTEVEDIDQIVELASTYEIYDLIKVEYINEDVEKTYAKLYRAAYALLKSRLKLYQESSSIKLSGKSRILADNFYTLSPKTQYRQYQAFESSNVTIQNRNYNYSAHYIKKETRKQRTFYYDGVSAAGFDKIINNGDPKVGLQYAITLSMIYELE